MRHGAGEGGHSLTVTDVEADVRVGNEELYDDAVLVADGDVDGCSAFRILPDEKKSFKTTRSGADCTPGKGSFCAGLQGMEPDLETAEKLA